MALLTVIGRRVRVRGRVTGEADLTIEGHVEGEIAVTGDVTIDGEGTVAASVSGRVITVRGAVKGDLTAEEAIRLEDGARVVGAVRAPRIAIARGALVRGHVQTAGASGRPAQPKAHTAAAQVAAAHRASSAVAAPRTSPPTSDKRPSIIVNGPRAIPAPRTIPAPPPQVTKIDAKGPPPPTVPSLKKGAKGALKKKAT